MMVVTGGWSPSRSTADAPREVSWATPIDRVTPSDLRDPFSTAVLPRSPLGSKRAPKYGAKPRSISMRGLGATGRAVAPPDLREPGLHQTFHRPRDPDLRDPLYSRSSVGRLSDPELQDPFIRSGFAAAASDLRNPFTPATPVQRPRSLRRSR